MTRPNLRLVRRGDRPLQFPTPIPMQAAATLDRAEALAQDLRDLSVRLHGEHLPACIDRAAACQALDGLIQNAAALLQLLGGPDDKPPERRRDPPDF